MADYVWVDPEGNEVKRERKGRGRTKSGFKEGKNGDYYQIMPDEKAKSIAQEKERIALQKEQEIKESIKSEREERSEQKIRKRKEKMQWPLRTFLSGLHYAEEDFFEGEDYINIYSPIIASEELKLDNLPFNAVYSRIELDKKTGLTSIWILVPKGSPDFQIENMIIVENLYD